VSFAFSGSDLGPLSLSLSLSLYFVTPFAACFVGWSLPGFDGFHHFCGFKSLVTCFLFLAIFSNLHSKKTQIFLFIPKTLSPQCEDSPQKTKEKTNNLVYAPPNNLHFTKFQQSIGVI
jgi:hypothetical protein